MQIACITHTMEEQVIITKIFASSYQTLSALLKSVIIVLHLFQIAGIPLIYHASLQSIAIKLYMIPMSSPKLENPMTLPSMSHFQMLHSLAVKQKL